MEHFGVTPDIMVMAKGLASGLPLSGIAARQEIMAKWHPGSHGGTYGGNALACAAAVATIRAIQEEHLVENAAKLGNLLKAELMGAQRRQRVIGDVRGLGMMIGVELIDADGGPDAALCKRVLAGCRERGLLLLNCGSYDNVVRFIPPLVADEGQVRQAARIFEETLAS
jgi:4-aminobutyrate aminotransferase